MIRCRQCRNVLGAAVAGEVVIRYHGREWVGRVYSIRCEKCGAVWRAGEQVLIEHGHGQGEADEDRTAAPARG
jgi:uncharacterized Zn finger protein